MVFSPSSPALNQSVARTNGVSRGRVRPAAVAVVYAFLVGAFIHRELGGVDIRRVLIKSAGTTAMLART